MNVDKLFSHILKWFSLGLLIVAGYYYFYIDNTEKATAYFISSILFILLSDYACIKYKVDEIHNEIFNKK